MMIGSLGSIPFYTSADESVLIDNLDWETTARYVEHTRHNQTDMLEYVGSDPDKISFEITLSAFLGVNPKKMLERLTMLMSNREAVKFVLGTIPIPGYWVVTNMDRQMEHLHKDGTLLSCVVKITLMEYVTSVQMPIISNRLSFTDRMATAVTVSPSAGANRKPVISRTDKTVRISAKPTTKPPAGKKTTVSSARALGTALGTAIGIGVKVVKAVSNVAKKYNVVEVLKNAVSNRSYNATKTTSAKPVVARKDSGVNPSSTKHNAWINTVK